MSYYMRMHQNKYRKTCITKNGHKTGENDANQVWSGQVAELNWTEPDKKWNDPDQQKIVKLDRVTG